MQRYDQPITSNDPKKAEKKQSESQFPNEKDFHAYTRSYQQQEIAYTEEKLTKGIELLAQQGLISSWRSRCRMMRYLNKAMK